MTLNLFFTILSQNYDISFFSSKIFRKKMKNHELKKQNNERISQSLRELLK